MQAIGEARIAIEDYVANPDGGTEVPRQAEALAQELKAHYPTWIPWAIAALVAAASVGTGWYIATRPAPLRPLVQINMELDPDAPIPADAANPLAISPDGSRIVVVLRGADGKSL